MTFICTFHSLNELFGEECVEFWFLETQAVLAQVQACRLHARLAGGT